LWIGALYPLLLLSRTPELLKVQKLMRSFGMLALGIVASLLLSGLYLATRVLQDQAELVNTAYGRSLLLKLSGVGVLLLLAAANKLVLVPKLLMAGSSTALQRSIRVEIAVAVYVLAVTSWLTTATGPSGI
jgi:putative copper resistance protein D